MPFPILKFIFSDFIRESFHFNVNLHKQPWHCAFHLDWLKSSTTIRREWEYPKNFQRIRRFHCICISLRTKSNIQEEYQLSNHTQADKVNARSHFSRSVLSMVFIFQYHLLLSIIKAIYWGCFFKKWSNIETIWWPEAIKKEPNLFITLLYIKLEHTIVKSYWKLYILIGLVVLLFARSF